MKRALDRPFRPPRSPRAGRARHRGRAGRGAGARPRGYTPTGPVRAGTRQRHAGVSTHHGHPGTRRHTHPVLGRVCRLMTAIPGQVDTPDRKWRAGAHPAGPAAPSRAPTPGRPPGRRGQRAGSDPGRPRAKSAGQSERAPNPLPHRLTSSRSDHTRPATTEPRAERARPPTPPGHGPPAAGNDNRPRPPAQTQPPPRAATPPSPHPLSRPAARRARRPAGAARRRPAHTARRRPRPRSRRPSTSRAWSG